MAKSGSLGWRIAAGLFMKVKLSFGYIILSILLVALISSKVGAVTALYDEQSGLTFTGNFTAIVYNVSAVAQSAVSGTGPAYLINGYSNLGYWYQIGLSYDWVTNASNSHYDGFMANYEVFAPNGTDINPGNNAGGVVEINGNVNPGDRVELGLYINKTTSTVKMSLYDWTTGAYFSTYYSSFGATQFVGNPYSVSTVKNGFFTGLMTEWYNVNPTFGNQLEVWYQEYGTVQQSAWLWIDEFYCSDGWQCNSKQNIFFNSTSAPVYTNYSTVFSAEGFANEYYGYGEDFLTGVSASTTIATTTVPYYITIPITYSTTISTTQSTTILPASSSTINENSSKISGRVNSTNTNNKSGLMLAAVIGIAVAIAIAIVTAIKWHKGSSSTGKGIFCSKCGTRNSDDAKFCKKCGKKL